MLTRRTRAQVALESLVVLAGLFAFVAVIWTASLPLQDAAMRSASRIADEASFESLRAAVRLAAVSAPGFSSLQSWHLRHNVTLQWDSRALAWSGPVSNRTLDAPFFSAGSLALESGVHSLRVHRTAGGIGLEVV